jgi:hypothetical protein
MKISKFVSLRSREKNTQLSISRHHYFDDSKFKFESTDFGSDNTTLSLSHPDIISMLLCSHYSYLEYRNALRLSFLCCFPYYDRFNICSGGYLKFLKRFFEEMDEREVEFHMFIYIFI